MTSTEGDLALACATMLADELARAGVTAACVSPGSRSAPLALAFERHPSIQVFVHLDERSAGFFAVGRARATGAPVAVLTTSGTAAANLLPAVVEASMARVPLIVLTADRPPELRDTGANQTIDQIGLYGSYVRMFADAGVPAETDGAARYWRSLAARAAAASRGPVPGPVHLNCPFREPLVPTGATVDLGSAAAGRANGQPWHSVVDSAIEPRDEDVALLAATVAASERGIIVAGGMSSGGDAVATLAATCGWPLIAEPLSGARAPGSVAAGQALIGDERFRQAHRPEVVIQFGESPTTRATQELVASASRLIVVGPEGRRADPARAATRVIRAEDAVLARALSARLPACSETAWLKDWRDADAVARAALDSFLDEIDEPFEPRVARDVASALPDGATLFVGASTPVRDLDMAMHPRHGLRVIGNRGASGIDGTVSSVLGVASAGAPTFGLVGDLALLHDASGFVWSARRGPAATLVVINNNGGGIFDLLPPASLPEHERLFITPHGTDLRALAHAAGADHARVERGSELIDAVLAVDGSPRVRIVEVPVDRARAVALRAEMKRRVSDALGV